MAPRDPKPPSSLSPNPGPENTPANLWAPWRLGYLESLDEQGPPPAKASPTGCFLSDYWLDPHDDEKNHVIVRTPEGLILLNAYPYANGHLLVALGEGRPTLLDYEPAQRATLWRLVDTAAELMQAALEPQGINIGINQGRAAGAGVPGHLHVHLVPRWAGDVNFISVVGQIRVIPSALEQMAQRYRAAWNRLLET
ncbi:MAG: HIT domain-containing protein [Phycisphaerales bacterium]